MPRALPAARLDGRDASQGGEGSVVADAPVVEPGDQLLRGDDGANAGLVKQGRSRRVLLAQQLRIEFGELG